MNTRCEDWRFGPVCEVGTGLRAWYDAHEPVVDRWLSEMEASGDAWWPSAGHAAFCLVSFHESEVGSGKGTLSWDDFDVPRFLFEDLWEGGTVADFGSVEIFFDHLVEALHRFTRAGLIEREDSATWIAQMLDARADFVRCYGEDSSELEAITISRRNRGLPEPGPSGDGRAETNAIGSQG